MRLISTRTRTKKYVNKPQEVTRSKENKQSAGRQPRPDDRGRREAQCTALRIPQGRFFPRRRRTALPTFPDHSPPPLRLGLSDEYSR